MVGAADRRDLRGEHRQREQGAERGLAELGAEQLRPGVVHVVDHLAPPQPREDARDREGVGGAVEVQGVGAAQERRERARGELHVRDPVLEGVGPRRATGPHGAVAAHLDAPQELPRGLAGTAGREYGDPVAAGRERLGLVAHPGVLGVGEVLEQHHDSARRRRRSTRHRRITTGHERSTRPRLTGFRNPAELDGPRKRVAVVGAQRPAVQRLTALLEHVYPVSFAQGDRPDAVIVLDPERLPEVPTGVPRLVLAAPAQSEGRATRGESRARVVALADDSQLARPLRGRAIADSASDGELPPPRPGVDRVLASVEERPVWWQAVGGSSGGAEPGWSPVGLWFSVYPLAEPGEGETLREHLKAGRFMGLLPLVHFLGRVAGAEGWTLPAPRASFVVDDPNLHWPSYGYLKYGELIAHARRHGYHMGLATVPLDRWRVDRRAAALVRDNGAELSLLMHGNDHVAQELGRLRSDREAESAIAQALRRTAALERRSGVGIDRVMVPPHSACSEEALRAAFALGIEAACLNQSYPWREGLPAPTPLGEWHPAELVAGGLPMLLRSPLVDPREDLAFRALLGQPLILYGHHWDFADGLDILAQAARDINALGEVRWGPLGSVARSGYATRRVGETLFVRLHARRIAIEVPAGVRELRVFAHEPLGGAGWQRLAHGGSVASMAFEDGLGASEPLPVEAPGRIELTLIADRPLNPAEVPARAPRPWPLIRRVMVEGRDRVQGLR